MSETRSCVISEGRLTCGPRGRKGTYISTKTQRIERYDSFFELLRILDQDDSVVAWTKQHSIRIVYVFDDHDRTYTPDFLIEYSSGKSLEEIKGYEDPVKLAAKIDALQHYCNSHQLIMRVIDATELERMCQLMYGLSIAALRYKEKRS